MAIGGHAAVVVLLPRGERALVLVPDLDVLDVAMVSRVSSIRVTVAVGVPLTEGTVLVLVGLDVLRGNLQPMSQKAREKSCELVKGPAR